MSRQKKSEEQTDMFEQGPSSHKGIGDVFKKVVSATIGSTFLNEEGVKGLLQDIPLPKELLSQVVNMAKSSKEDFMNAMAQEIRQMLNRVDISSEIEKILDKYDFDVELKIRPRKKNKESSNE